MRIVFHKFTFTFNKLLKPLFSVLVMGPYRPAMQTNICYRVQKSDLEDVTAVGL